ncbi:MAG: hypothetical protein AUK47_05575 [Deltaproteobacteria bacterium CG2_30_63_29]|nr:MAG: hypothetical protein AUK47_05575 [Deltaproteobacteria bacterium CG2_30_63_29]PJB39490.1 MAG: hypothetical protein CO108_17230 [Deltaproteobacteria bacterium CG_4_9_14_3_um_filter_63_12]
MSVAKTVWMLAMAAALASMSACNGKPSQAAEERTVEVVKAQEAAADVVSVAYSEASKVAVYDRALASVTQAAVAALEPNESVLASVARAAYARGDTETGLKAYAAALARGPLSADHTLMHGESLLAAKRPEEARAVLIEGEAHYLSDLRFAPLIERSLDEDPRFIPEVRTLKSDVDLDAIKYLGGGSTIVLRLLKDKQTIGAFKPKQNRQQSDFRSEIAAWRICPMIRCGFEIPYNQHVRLTWRDFDGLYSRLTSEKQVAYRENLEDLVFIKEDGVDWVHGTLKDWVPEFTQLPIEIGAFWRPWLALESELTALEAPATDILKIIRKLHPSGERLERELTQHMGTMTKRDLARQLSNMLAYDFLINNWDRFSGVKEFWGVNCQFANGHIVSIDNGAAFPKTTNEKVDKHLQDVQRFSRQLVKAVRELDHDRTLARLFPEATDYERERYETFWTQRTLFLAYVDGLIAAHGESAVLAFD